MKAYYLPSIILGGLTIGLVPQTSFALDIALGDKGINIRELQTKYSLTGEGIKIGQVEVRRSPMMPPDSRGHDFLKTISRVAINGLTAQQDIGISGHATQVAGVIISDNPNNNFDGIVPKATLYSSGYWKKGDAKPEMENQEKASQAAQWVIDQGTSIINFSFGDLLDDKFYIPKGNAKKDGKNLLSAFVDWGTLQGTGHLFVQAGNQDPPEYSVPTDAYNNIVVGNTRKNGGIFAQFNSLRHDFDPSPRRKLDILAPGTDISNMPDYVVGNVQATKDVNTGTSFAAPMVTGLAAQLQQNAGNGKKDPHLIKAVIMNAADKIKGMLEMGKTIIDKAGKDWRQSEAYTSQTIPLDDEMGVGQANGVRAKKQYDAGEHKPGIVPLIGWDVNEIASSAANKFHDYVFDKVLKVGDWVSATLDWNRTVNLVDNVGGNQKYDIGDSFSFLDLGNYNLFLMKKDETDTNKAVWSSKSSVDNVEHIFHQVPETGEYKLRVVLDGNFVAGANPSFALAWWTQSCLPTTPSPNPKQLSLQESSVGCLDLGDAPESYITKLDPSEPNNPLKGGPRYQEGNSQRLGDIWDDEDDGQPTPLADGDDKSILGGCTICGISSDGVDDEDGIIFGDSWVDVIFNISRPDPSPYQLRAWWDFNKNGVFDHASELFIDDLQTVGPGTFTRRYNLGFDPRKYYSRFRLTWNPMDLDVKPFGEYYSDADCNATDAAAGNCISHGEVEDYPPVPEPSSILGLFTLAGLGLTRLRQKRSD